jgi:predicted TIM-barrel fold metal-dependent hydrolase
MPQVEWLRGLDVAPEVREAIAAGNARRVLGLG